ncbi:hypothetical protein HMPREF9296_0722 [Prevotella disiens FB035-09AN]|uniref:Uncharacterized protein n=1 Tax=Prevotella disiens FB035-09AN TaxID=866771 RepID=E1KTE3_9BACT|nr:hypothetical protein HMPREF9296_0722 [Prevotella disiens FB035-09AN]
MFFDASNIDVFALYKGVQWIIQACIKDYTSVYKAENPLLARRYYKY